MYSGPVAAHSYLALSEEKKPDTAIILCPNHTGIGSALSLMGEGVWETPLGRVSIDEEISKSIFKASGMVDMDESAHAYEHSIEVQLPFLQYLYGSTISIVPICMGLQDLDVSRNLGEAIAEATKSQEHRHNRLDRHDPPGVPAVRDAEGPPRPRRNRSHGRGTRPRNRPEQPDHHVWIRPRLRCHRRIEEARRGQGRNLIIPHERGYNG